MKKVLSLILVIVLAFMLFPSSFADGDPYTITFDPQNGSASTDISTGTDGKIPVESWPEDPSYADHVFQGWTLNGVSVSSDTVFTENSTVYAQWKSIYTVTFDPDGGTPIPDPVNVYEGETVSEPTQPTKDANIFDGWLSSGNPYDFSQPVMSDLSLKAKWIPQYTVTFDTDGGTPIPDPVKVYEGETVSEPTQPTKDAYKFDGWLLSENPYDFSQPVRSDLSLKAKWLPQYTVTFDSDGGTPTPEPVYVYAGETVSEPAQPTKDASIFDVWLSSGNPYDFSQPVMSDLSLKAKWIPQYTITFDPAGGKVDPQTMLTDREGKIVQSTVTPTKQGYKFLGWYLNDSLVTDDEVYSSDTTLTAKWELMKYNFTVRQTSGNGTTQCRMNAGEYYTLSNTGESHTFTNVTIEDRIYISGAPKTGLYTNHSAASGFVIGGSGTNYLDISQICTDGTINISYSSNPQTGDSSSWGYVVTGFVAFTVACACVIIYRKLRRN